MQPIVTESLPTSRAATLERLGRARARTLALVEPLAEDALNRVHDPLMSPIVWDLGHIATFEDLWVAQNGFGKPPLREGLGQIYDPSVAPRSERGELPYLRSEDCAAYMTAVRERTLELLESGAEPLLGNFVYELILRHEQQHSETILQTIQISGEAYRPHGARAIASAAVIRRSAMLVMLVPSLFDVPHSSA